MAGDTQTNAEQRQPAARAAPVLPGPALPPRPSNPRYASFDIWRGVACLCLVLYHACFYAEHAFRLGDPQTWTFGAVGVRLIGLLWMGVPIFFVISGYCIASSLDSLRRKPNPLANYFTRRMRRIYPPLWVALFLGVGAWWLMGQNAALYQHCDQRPDFAAFTGWNWLGNIFAAESWLPLVTGSAEPTFVMNNTWTLCYEEQFYAVAGLVLLLAPRKLFLASGILTALVLIARHAARSGDVSIAGLFLDGHWLLFAAGIAVFQALHYTSPKGRWAIGAVLLAGMFYGAADYVLQSDKAARHLDEYIFVSCGFGIALIAGRTWDARIAGLKLLQPLAWCGRISYSIYLTHYPLVVGLACAMSLWGCTSDTQVLLLVVPTSLVVSLPIAWLFHVQVERRFMNDASPNRTAEPLPKAAPSPAGNQSPA